MPGRMGGKQRTVKNVWVYRIDPARNLMWLRGQVSFSCKYIIALKLNEQGDKYLRYVV